MIGAARTKQPSNSLLTPFAEPARSPGRTTRPIPRRLRVARIGRSDSAQPHAGAPCKGQGMRRTRRFKARRVVAGAAVFPPGHRPYPDRRIAVASSTGTDSAAVNPTLGAKMRAQLAKRCPQVGICLMSSTTPHEQRGHRWRARLLHLAAAVLPTAVLISCAQSNVTVIWSVSMRQDLPSERRAVTTELLQRDSDLWLRLTIETKVGSTSNRWRYSLGTYDRMPVRNGKAGDPGIPRISQASGSDALLTLGDSEYTLAIDPGEPPSFKSCRGSCPIRQLPTPDR